MHNALILNSSTVLKRGFALKWSTSFRFFWSLVIFSTVALLIFYIFQVNAEISERYSIQGYKEKISEISKENQDLEIKAVQLNSLDKAIKLLGSLNFEKTNKIYYIRTLDKQVVAK